MHIGNEKIISISPQDFLHLNRSALASTGFLFTEAAAFKEDNLSGVTAHDPKRRNNLPRTLELRDVRGFIAFQSAVVDALRNPLNHVTYITTEIPSPEHNQSRPWTDEEMERLISILASLRFAPISILIHLSEAPELANSSYSTLVKYGGTLNHPPGRHYPRWSNVCYLRRTLLRFAARFYQGSITPRICSKAYLIKQSIIDDFTHAIGLPIEGALFTVPPPRNENPPSFCIEILRRINGRIPALLGDPQLNLPRGAIVAYFKVDFREGNAYDIPHEMRQEYHEAFKSSKDRVRARYFPYCRMLFSAPYMPPVHHLSCKPQHLDRFLRLISEIWLIKTNEIPAYQNNRTYREYRRLRRRTNRLLKFVRPIIRLSHFKKDESFASVKLLYAHA